MVLWDLENLHVSASDMVLGRGHASRALPPTPLLPYTEISKRLRAELPYVEGRRVISNLVFADWARFGCYCAEVLQARGKPMQAFAPTRKIKNTADMYMTIAALDELHRKDGARQFILVSGDSDFIPLATRLLSAGCEVWVVSFRDAASAVLLGMVDRFIELNAWMPKAQDIVDPTPKAGGLPASTRNG